MKKKFVFVHGGEVFASQKHYENYLKNKTFSLKDYIQKPKSWKKNFFSFLEEQNIAILQIAMPCRENAKYKHWKIIFTNHLHLFDKNTIFAGHSLGATFLIKFFSEKNIGYFPQLHLISPATTLKEGGFNIKKDLSLLNKQFKEIYIYHSKDDFVVPFSDSEKLVKKINAVFKVFKSRNHFLKSNSPNLEKTIKF